MKHLSVTFACVALVSAPMLLSASAQSQSPAENEAEAPSDDPFAQFDIAVTNVVDGQEDSEAWTPLARSGLRFNPAVVTVEPEQRVDDLIEAQGVRADIYSRSLVQLLNPELANLNAVEAGQTLAMFDVEALSPNYQRLALLPYQSSRLEARSVFEAVSVDLEQARTRFSAREYDGLNREFTRLARTYRDYFSASPELNAEAAQSLRRYRSEVRDALSRPSADASVIIIERTGAADREVREASEPGSQTRDGRYRIPVKLALNGQDATANPGRCVLGWAVNGWQTRHPTYHDLPPVPSEVRSYPSPLQFWVERGGRVISTPRPAPFNSNQVIAQEEVTVNLLEPCT